MKKITDVIILALCCIFILSACEGTDYANKTDTAVLPADKLEAARIIYFGDNQSLIAEAKKYGLKIKLEANIDKIENIADYNIIIIENSYIKKVDRDMIMKAFENGTDVFFNNVTSTEEISKIYLGEKSYEEEKPQNNERTLIKLFNGRDSDVTLYHTTYSYPSEPEGLTNMLRTVVLNSDCAETERKNLNMR